MVAFGAHTQHGGGVIDNLMRPFTRSEILYRDKIGDNRPLNDLDATAKEHDFAYLREKEGYDRDHNKVKHMRNIHRADDVFINKAKNSRDDPIMGKVSSKLMSAKKGLEEAGLMDTKQFSGFGAEEGSENADPVARLREIVKKEYKTDAKRVKKKVSSLEV